MNVYFFHVLNVPKCQAGHTPLCNAEVIKLLAGTPLHFHRPRRSWCWFKPVKNFAVHVRSLSMMRLHIMLRHCNNECGTRNPTYRILSCTLEADLYIACLANAMPMPCSDHAVLLKATAQHGRRATACGLPAGVRIFPATTRSSTKIVTRSMPFLLTTIHTYDRKEW